MIRAVVGDTWKQSRQQLVFIVMLVVMLVLLIGGIALPRPIITSDGEKHFGTLLSDKRWTSLPTSGPTSMPGRCSRAPRRRAMRPRPASSPTAS